MNKSGGVRIAYKVRQWYHLEDFLETENGR